VSPERELKESLAHIAMVMAARDRVVGAARVVAKSARSRRKRRYTQVDLGLQRAIDELEALEKKA